MSNITVIYNDVCGSQGTITFTHRGITFRTTIETDYYYNESPLEEMLGDVLVVHEVSDTPDSYNSMGDFIEDEGVPDNFGILYEGGLMRRVDWYTDTHAHAYLDYMATFHNMQTEWGYDKPFAEAKAHIDGCFERMIAFRDGYWTFVAATTELLDAEDNVVDGYSDSCGGYRSYMFDSTIPEYQWGLEVLEEQAGIVYNDYVTKYAGQLVLPLEDVCAN